MFIPLSIESMFIVTVALFMLAALFIVALLYTDAMKQKAVSIKMHGGARHLPPRPTLKDVTATELRVARIHTPKEY